jgi:hypothetical protein
MQTCALRRLVDVIPWAVQRARCTPHYLLTANVTSLPLVRRDPWSIGGPPQTRQGSYPDRPRGRVEGCPSVKGSLRSTHAAGFASRGAAMQSELLTTDELTARIKYDSRTIRERLKDSVLIEGVHYIRPFGGRKILYVWDRIAEDMAKPSSEGIVGIPMANGGILRGYAIYSTSDRTGRSAGRSTGRTPWTGSNRRCRTSRNPWLCCAAR